MNPLLIQGLRCIKSTPRINAKPTKSKSLHFFLSKLLLSLFSKILTGGGGGGGGDGDFKDDEVLSGLIQ